MITLGDEVIAAVGMDDPPSAAEEEVVSKERQRKLTRAVQIGKRLARPVRIENLELVGEHPRVFAAELSRSGVGNPSNVGYHVNEAAKIGCLRMADTEPTRHIDSLTPLGQSILSLVAEL